MRGAIHIIKGAGINPNLQDIQQWFQALLYFTEFRATDKPRIS